MIKSGSRIHGMLALMAGFMAASDPKHQDKAMMYNSNALARNPMLLPTKKGVRIHKGQKVFAQNLDGSVSEVSSFGNLFVDIERHAIGVNRYGEKVYHKGSLAPIMFSLPDDGRKYMVALNAKNAKRKFDKGLFIKAA